MDLFSKIRQRQALREILANITWLSTDRIVRMLGAVIVGTAVARYLGPSSFGLLNYALAIYTLFNVISNLGLDSLVVREVTLFPDLEHEILGTSFWLKIGASVVTTIIATITALILSPNDRVVAIIVMLMSVASISQGFDVIDYLFQAKIQSRRSVIPRNIVFIFSSVARLLAVYLRASLIVFGWISALEVFFSEIGLAISYLRLREKISQWVFVSKRANSLLRESWPLMLAAIMYIVFMRTDQVMLGKMASPREAGEYTAAGRLSEVWYAIPVLICNSILPKLLRDREQTPELYRTRMQRLYNLFTIASVTLAACTSLISSTVIHLMYGNEYHEAAKVLAIHIWSSVFVCMGVVGAGQLVHDRLTHLELQRCVIGAIANVGLNWLWIPKYGAIGSAYATLCTHAATSYLADAINPATHLMMQMKTRALVGFGLIFPERNP